MELWSNTLGWKILGFGLVLMIGIIGVASAVQL